VQIQIRQGSSEDVPLLAPLWVAMVEHHRAVVAEPWPVREAGDAWARRREEYLSGLADESGFLLVAHASGSSDPVGYCFCELVGTGPTFEVGPLRGDVGSLAVTPSARGAGVGTALLRECRAELARRGIAYWSIGVVEGNDGARALYERVGFRPWVRTLLAPVDPAG
jgi:ribosomal protein S18 acetylase RimI-like enzyme